MSRFDQHVPDILDCLAQLSNDEVPTSPKLARAMLDLLPEHVWHEPDYLWLDPFSKSGVFLREIATRLLDGLVDWEPDFAKRREHIFRNMLYGAAITEMTGIISRRSVYCTADASSTYSVVRFDDPAGNIPYIPSVHDFDADGKCKICRAPQTLVRDNRENYAYSLIHGTYPTKEISAMKFDVIVGNPPFQVGDGGGGGGASASPLYNLFVERVLDLEPRHAVVITPSRWFSGGKGLDAFRDRMLKDERFVELIDHPTLYDCFPGVKIRGGVSYWHWDRDHSGPCSVTTKVGDKIISGPVERPLHAYDVFVRRNESVEILDKIAFHEPPEPSLGAAVSTRKPFGDISAPKGRYAPKDSILIYGNQKTFQVDRSVISSNTDWIDKWKVLLVKAHGTSGREDRTIVGHPIVAGPGSACTETYLVIGVFDSEDKANNLAAYTQTLFFRFLVSLRKLTQNMTRDSYRFVPRLPMNRTWTDEDLFERYSLTTDEVAHIESLISPRHFVGPPTSGR
jgi:site-specific DNA-methyltransferase (adenine-specific)